jgi:hypothetical protein
MPPAQPKRRRLRTVLIVLGIGIVILVIAGIVGRGSAPTRNAVDGKTEKPGSLSVIDLQPGDCYNAKELPPAPGTTQPISTVEVVPCTTPHTTQVVEKITYKATDSYTDVRATRASADCNAAFQAALPQTVLADPAFTMGLITPRDQITWMRHPVVACTVGHPTSVTSLLT